MSKKDILPGNEPASIMDFGGGASTAKIADNERMVDNQSGAGVYHLNKALPGTTIKLPSLGRVYPTLNIPSELRLRAMSLRQMMILNTPALWANDDVFPMIIRDCVSGLPSGVDVVDLHPDDKDALLIALRILSFGRKYKVPVQCPKKTCEHQYNHVVDLETDFPVLYLDEKQKVEIPTNITKDLLWEQRGARVKPLSWKETMELDRMDEWRRKNKDKDPTRQNEEYIINERLLDELQLGIIDVEGIGSSKAAIREWLLETSAHDASIINQMMNKYNFGIKTVFSPAPCPACGNKFQTSLPITFDFFRATLPETENK